MVLIEELDEPEPEELEEPEAEGASGAGGAKKKKKKKKPKKPACPDGDSADTNRSQNVAHTDSAERFASTLEALKRGDEVAVVGLSRCNIGDKKARKLIEALRHCEAVTSIDLSDNLMSDTSATALAGALGAGCCPRLVELRLDGNPLTPPGISGVSGALAPRPALALGLPRAAPRAEPSDANGDFAAYVASVPTGSTPADSFDGAAAVLSAVCAGDACGAAVTEAVATVLSAVRAELAELHGATPKLLPRALRWCAKGGVPRLATLLGCAPVGARSARSGAVDRLGRHRLFTVELVASLVRARRGPLTAALLDAKPSLPRRCVALILDHPACSPLHVALLGFARDVLSTGGSKPLRLAIFADAPSPPSPPLAALLAEAALRAPSGREQHTARATLVAILSAVQAAVDEGDKQLGARLSEWPKWSDVRAALPALRAETTEGQLCGPPPERPAVGAGGMNGEEAELMALLSKLSADGSAKLVTS